MGLGEIKRSERGIVNARVMDRAAVAQVSVKLGSPTAASIGVGRRPFPAELLNHRSKTARHR
jgi:hypothetical protein